MKHQRLVLLAFVVGAILCGIVLRAAVESALLQAGYPDQQLLGGLVTTSVAVGLVTTVVAFVAVIRNRKAVRFADEVVSELTKVTWPTRDETLRATTTVIFTSLFISALIFLYDQVWKFVADLVLFTEG